MKNLILSIIFLLSSCAKNLGTSEADVYQVIEQLGSGVSFEQLRDQVLVPKCLRCHAWVADEEQVLERVMPGEPLKSVLFNLVDNDAMPVGGPKLADVEKDIINQYILGLVQGGDDDNVDDVEPPVQIVDYEIIKQEILQPSCLRCHGDMGTIDGFLKYIDNEDPLSSNLLEVIESGFMPLRSARLDEDKIQLLREFLVLLK